MSTQPRATDAELDIALKVDYMSDAKIYELEKPGQSDRQLRQHSITGRVATRLDVFYKKRVVDLLTGIDGGIIDIVDENGDPSRYGSTKSESESLIADITIHDKGVWRDVALRGSIGAAEAYAEGRWSTSDLVSVVRVMARNTALTDKMEKGFARLFTLAAKFDHALRRNSKTGSKKNIHAHYDLGNDFFRLFLDKQMMYSSAVFPGPDADLDQASMYKLERICRKLDLGSENHLLEIGSGWGGLAVYAAKNYGCRVTTATISRRQFEYVKNLIQQNQLQDRVEVVLEDYRNLTGKFDRLVSVEMVEAVGHQYLDRYFDVCQQLMTSDGRMLIQAITVPDDRYDVSRRGVDFIQKYIFPGGGLPSLAVVLQSISRRGQIRLVHFEELAEHYARTLAIWRQRFLANRSHIVEMGFSEEFIRLWEYYFAYCEGGFFERSTGLGQMLFVGSGVTDDEVNVESLSANSCVQF